VAPCESGIGLSSVSAEVKPLNRTESGRKYVKTSVEVIRQDFLQLLLKAAYKTLAQCLLEDIRLFLSVEAYEAGQRRVERTFFTGVAPSTSLWTQPGAREQDAPRVPGTPPAARRRRLKRHKFERNIVQPGKE